MQKTTSYRKWSAVLLLLVFASMWMLKMGHALSAHHRHLERPVCEAATDHSTTHLHDERYAGQDCSLCAFVLAVPDYISFSAFISSAPSTPDTSQPLLYESLRGKTAFDTTVLRGPPAI